MNAYELADELDALFTKLDWEEIPNVVSMLRQQADRIAELEDKLSFYEIKDLDSGLKPKPLSDEEIQVLINDVPDYDIGIYELFQFARAIEERHGIK